jgi:hypothetical protein
MPKALSWPPEGETKTKGETMPKVGLSQPKRVPPTRYTLQAVELFNDMRRILAEEHLHIQGNRGNIHLP